MNRLYYEIAAREAYEQGKTEGLNQVQQPDNSKYEKVLEFLHEHKDKNNYLSKKIRKLLEDLGE